jgi:hypothetical protein
MLDMRTTLDIDEDILRAAKDIARAEGKTMGQVISALARKALTAPSAAGFSDQPQAAFVVDTGDWPLLPNRDGVVVTQELVEKILDELDAEDATPFDHAAGAPRKF